MDYSVYKISLDIHKPEAQEVLEMKLLDSKRRIQISLTENGKVYQITPDCKAMFSAGKSDGNKIYNQCEIVGNTIIYNVTQQTLACLGEVDCEVQLLGSDEAVITSPRFSIIVHDRVYNGEDIVDSEMETDILPNLIAKSHEHDNKEVLDGITQELLDQIGTGGGEGGGLTPEQAAQLEANTEARHEHENKYLLDNFSIKDHHTNGVYYKDKIVWTANDGGVIGRIERRDSGDINIVVITDYREDKAILIKNPPTKVSQLENDSGYIVSDEFTSYTESMNYVIDDITTRIDGIEGGIDEIELTEETATLQPNVYYSFDEMATLTLEFAEGNESKVNEYMFGFVSGATPTVLTLPSSVKWANELTIEANKRYEISIVDNIGLWCAVEVDV